MPPVILVRRGERITVDSDSPDFAKRIDQGYAPEASDVSASIAHDQGRVESQNTLTGTLRTGASNLIGGITAGGSRALEALIRSDIGREEMRLGDRANPDVATGARVVGGLVQGALLPGPSLAAGAGARAVALHAAKSAGVGALLGAADTGGNYIADQLIAENPHLTAEGFWSSLAPGALWGGAAGGVFGATEAGVRALRKLYGRTPEVVARGERAVEAATMRGVDSPPLAGAGRGYADDALDAGISIPDVAQAPRERAPSLEHDPDGIRIADIDPDLTRKSAEDITHQARVELDAQLADTETLARQVDDVATAAAGPRADDPAILQQLASGGIAAPPARKSFREFQREQAAAGVRSRAEVGAAWKKYKAALDAGPSIADQEALLAQQLEASVAAGPDGIEAARAQRVAAAAKVDQRVAAAKAAANELRAARADVQRLVDGPNLRRFDEAQAFVGRPASERRAAVAEWVDARRGEADAARDAARSSGRLRPEADVAPEYTGHGDILRARLGEAGRVGDERAAINRLRKPLTDAEQAAVDAPRFIDPETGGYIDSENLAGYLLKRGTRLEDLQGERLVPRDGGTFEYTNPRTGEVTTGRVRHQIVAERGPVSLEDVLATARRGDAGDAIIENALINRLATEAPFRDARALRETDLRMARWTSTDADRAAFVAHATEQTAADAAVRNALRPRLATAADDAGENLMMPAIMRLERAEQDAVSLLGVDYAPPGSVRRAQALDAARTVHEDARSLASAQRADIVANEASATLAGRWREAPPAEDAAGFAPRRSRQAEARRAPATEQTPIESPGATASGRSSVLDAMAAMEVLAELNVPGLPSVRNLPVLGPVAALYLKGRAAVRAFQRFGGRIPRTTESVAASSAGAARSRLQQIAAATLGPAEGVARAARRAAPAATAILAHRLFSGGAASSGGDDKAALWRARSSEVIAALEPGAIARAVRAAVPASNPHLAAAMEELTGRQLSYLHLKMPVEPPMWGLGMDVPAWRPSDEALDEWARIVRATVQPLDVLEDGADGSMTYSQMEAIRTVFPALFSDGQRRILELALERKSIPAHRRAWLSTMWDVALDPSQTPAFLASQQARYAVSAQPNQGGPPAPSPAVAAPVNASSRAMPTEQG